MNRFDPSYGHTLNSLLEIETPNIPDDFSSFWRGCYEQCIAVEPEPTLTDTTRSVGDFHLYDLTFQSTGTITINGWVLIPKNKTPTGVLIVGHGYGGCDEPNGRVPCNDFIYVYICYRGISKSVVEGIPEEPRYHVLYNIHDREQYIIRGCVEDTWLAVSAVEVLFPDLKHHIAYMGISFSGGIGALALPWDKRIRMAHLEVPTFGHQPLRLELPTWGSARSVQEFYQTHPDVIETLSYYDAASAARFISVPVHVAVALYDPVVAPPGQFSIYNSLAKDKSLFVLEKGHSDYPNYQQEQDALLSHLAEFLSALRHD
jgi:cephalosporin-C deacetylase